MAGGSTGLLCKTFVGKDADQPVYKVDTGTLSMLLAHEKQAAEELGQWSERREVTVKPIWPSACWRRARGWPKGRRRPHDPLRGFAELRKASPKA